MSVLALRMGVFAGLLALLLVAERVWPKRPTRREGYLANIGIFLIDSVVTRVLLAVGGVAIAAYAASEGWGLFNIVELPAWLAILASVILLDLAVWAQHVATHKIPLLWRLHEVHHSDPDVDVLTGIRFHPAEIALSLFYKGAVILLLGAPVAAVIAFEIILNAGAMFSHSNLRLPRAVDRIVRLFTVTPDMHRVHHSVRLSESNTNYGFFLPWWDRLFRTYTDQPAGGHAAMTLGVADAPTDRRLRTLLRRPLDRRGPPKPAR